MPESAYRGYTYRLPELAHGYGPNVHLLADPILLSQLARLCRPEVVQPEITALVRDMYHSLVRMVIANEFPRELVHVKTRMYEQTERAVWSGDVLDSSTRAITVNIARALGGIGTATFGAILLHALLRGGTRGELHASSQEVPAHA